MQNNKDFFKEIDELIEESIYKTKSPIKIDSLKISNRPNKIFFYNKNKKDVNKEWKEIEKILQDKEQDIRIQQNEQQQQQIYEEHKIQESNKCIIKTPFIKIINEQQVETIKIKEQQEEIDKQEIDQQPIRKLTFNLD